MSQVEDEPKQKMNNAERARLGGLARATKVPPYRRREIATAAANARWDKSRDRFSKSQPKPTDSI